MLPDSALEFPFVVRLLGEFHDNYERHTEE